MKTKSFKHFKGRHHSRIPGFTLIELMIVVVIVALLVALALPSYAAFIRKSHRGEAQQLMMNYANLQEIWRANNNLYAPAASLPLPTADRYDLFVRDAASSPPTSAQCANTAPTATAYVVVACAKNSTDQINDKQSGVDCKRMSLSQNNVQIPNACW